MSRLYTVDVKAFISITVEAESEDEARETADNYVEVSLSPDASEIEAWNQTQQEEGVVTRIASAGTWALDGISDVAEA